MTIAIIILCILLLFCCSGWFVSWVGKAALCMHIVMRGYASPSDQELSAYIHEILRNLLNLKGRASRK